MQLACLPRGSCPLLLYPIPFACRMQDLMWQRGIVHQGQDSPGVGCCGVGNVSGRSRRGVLVSSVKKVQSSLLLEKECTGECHGLEAKELHTPRYCPASAGAMRGWSFILKLASSSAAASQRADSGACIRADHQRVKMRYLVALQAELHAHTKVCLTQTICPALPRHSLSPAPPRPSHLKASAA